jgi:hypothetical protein
MNNTCLSHGWYNIKQWKITKKKISFVSQAENPESSDRNDQE